MRLKLIMIVSVGALSAAPTLAAGEWTQWGGANRDFVARSGDIADSWPTDGPKQLWSQDLGGGYATILVDGDTLYTGYRDGDQDVWVALKAQDGARVWTQSYDSPIPEKENASRDDPDAIVTQFGKGPNATPLLHDGKLYTLGFMGVLSCFDQKTGELKWRHDLVKEYNAKTPRFGYSASPIVYKDTLIVLANAPERRVMAFKLDDGSVAWGAGETEVSYSSPILIEVDGQDQLVYAGAERVVGMSPKDGAQLWKFDHVNQFRTNIFTPVWCPGDILFVSSGGVGGRGLKLSVKDGKTNVEEAWGPDVKAGVGLSNALRIGDHLYVTAGQSKAYMLDVNYKTGEVEKLTDLMNVTQSQLVLADDKIIAMGEDGMLMLIKRNGDKLETVSAMQLFEVNDRSKCWTTPTIVGSKLYVRDFNKIVALDLQ